MNLELIRNIDIRINW